MSFFRQWNHFVIRETVYRVEQKSLQEICVNVTFKYEFVYAFNQDIISGWDVSSVTDMTATV